MPRRQGEWYNFACTPEEFKTLLLVVQACLDAGGDEDLLRPLYKRLVVFEAYMRSDKRVKNLAARQRRRERGIKYD